MYMATITIKIDSDTLAREVLETLGYIDYDEPPELIDDDEEEEEDENEP